MKKNWKEFNRLHLEELSTMNSQDFVYSRLKLTLFVHDNPECNYKQYYERAQLFKILPIEESKMQAIGFCLLPQTV